MYDKLNAFGKESLITQNNTFSYILSLLTFINTHSLTTKKLEQKLNLNQTQYQMNSKLY